MLNIVDAYDTLYEDQNQRISHKLKIKWSHSHDMSTKRTMQFSKITIQKNQQYKSIES